MRFLDLMTPPFDFMKPLISDVTVTNQIWNRIWKLHAAEI